MPEATLAVTDRPDGKRVLLFGPFATFSSKFLKNGSLFDLMHSLSTSNLMQVYMSGAWEQAVLVKRPLRTILHLRRPTSSSLQRAWVPSCSPRRRRR